MENFGRICIEKFSEEAYEPKNNYFRRYRKNYSNKKTQVTQEVISLQILTKHLDGDSGKDNHEIVDVKTLANIENKTNYNPINAQSCDLKVKIRNIIVNIDVS